MISTVDPGAVDVYRAAKRHGKSSDTGISYPKLMHGLISLSHIATVLGEKGRRNPTIPSARKRLKIRDSVYVFLLSRLTLSDHPASRVKARPGSNPTRGKRRTKAQTYTKTPCPFQTGRGEVSGGEGSGVFYFFFFSFLEVWGTLDE